jgi:2-phosphoglycerate kinase
MASYIKKTVCNLDVYYQGNDEWTNKFEDRKKYNTASDAQEEYAKYVGVIVNE